MDENKEALTPADTDTTDTEVNEAVQTAQDVTEEAAAEIAETGTEITADAAAEATEATAEDAFSVTEEKPEKKKMILNRAIFISLIIVIIGLIAALTVKYFFNTSLVGTDLFGNKTDTTWHYSQQIPYTDTEATGDEPSVKTADVDVFYEFGGDGKLTVKSGTITSEGTYTLRYVDNDDVTDVENADELLGKPIVELDVYDPVMGSTISGAFTYTVEGNVFSGKTLRIASLYSPDAYLDLDEKAFEETVLTHEDEFTPVEGLTGSWSYKSESGVHTYTFNSDGTMAIDILEPQYGYHIRQTGIYYCTDNTIDVTVFLCIKQDTTLNYTLRDGKFVLISDVPGMDGKPTEIEFERADQ